MWHKDREVLLCIPKFSSVLKITDYVIDIPSLLLFLPFMLKTHIQRTFLLLLMNVVMLGNIKAQDKITIIAPDKLLITADIYMVNDTLPYMILCHDIKSSRGEYKNIARRFNKLGYNCIAIDMRNGDIKNGVPDETASLAQAKHLNPKLIDSRIDIAGAINYAYEQSHKKVVLVGNGYSASLALYIGSVNPKVACVLAFNPGDYFKGTLNTKDIFPKCNIPVFVASNITRAAEVKKYVAGIPASKLTLFQPSSDGVPGVEALLSTSANHDDYWLSLLMYLHQLQGGS